MYFCRAIIKFIVILIETISNESKVCNETRWSGGKKGRWNWQGIDFMTWIVIASMVWSAAKVIDNVRRTMIETISDEWWQIRRSLFEFGSMIRTRQRYSRAQRQTRGQKTERDRKRQQTKNPMSYINIILLSQIDSMLFTNKSMSWNTPKKGSQSQRCTVACSQ